MGPMMIFIRRRYLLVAGGLFLLLLAGGILWGSRAISVSAGESRLVPVYGVDTPEQKIAISFDASWGAEHTEEILDVLDQYGVDATFFLVNIWLEDYPEMAKMIADRGYEIGLHSATHSHFPELSEEEIAAELESNHQLILDTTGYDAKVFRCPFGDYNNTVVSTVEQAGYTCVQWSIDSLDWKDYSADEIYNRVTKDAEAGDIVLFHNNGLHTAEALPAILEAYAEQGLEVVSVSELLLTGNTYTDQNGIQHMVKE